VQPGGFIAAAELSLNVNRVHSVSGEFYASGKEISPELAQKLGRNYTRQENQDHSYSKFHADSSASTRQIAAMAAAIAVSVWLGPQMSGWVGEAFGAAAGSGTAMAASANGVAAGLGNTLVSGTLTGMASSATGQLIATGRLDGGELFKSGLSAGLTAGLTQWAGQALNNATLMNTQQVGDAIQAGATATDLADKLVGYTVRAGISASVNQAVYGQQAGSFGDAFVNSFVASASADAANWVGGHTEPQSAQNLAAHALIGCAAAAATGRDCGAGAVGGATAAALNPLLDHLTSSDDKLLRDAQLAALSTAASGLVADVLGQDIGAAVSAAQNETLNNYLTQSQKTQMFRELDACAGLACKAQVYAKYGVASGQQDIAFASGIVIGATGRAAQVGVETVEGIGKIVEDIPGTLKALKEFVANLDAEQVKKIGAETVVDYKRRVDLFEQNYQTGGWRGAQDAGIEFGALVVDGAMLATGVGGAARLTVRLGVSIVEKAGGTANVAADQLAAAASKLGQINAETIQRFRSADELNALMAANDWVPAWKPGTQVAELTLAPGTKVRMVVDKNAWDAIGRGEFDRAFGGWATLDNVPNQAYARNQLAITREMKSDVGYVIEVEVARPVNAQIGVVGTQGSAAGGGNQLHFIIPPGERTSVFKVVGGRKLP